MAPNPNTIVNAVEDIEKKTVSEEEEAPLTAAQLLESEEELAILKKIMTTNKMPMISRLEVKKATVSNAAEADARSVYVGNVDYSVSTGELEDHFRTCGSISRVTIPTNYAKRPKGFGYIEFTDLEGAKKAISLTGSLLKGRQIKVVEKRTNQRGFHGGMVGGHPNSVMRPVVKYVYAGPPVDRSKYSKRYVPY